ncbi:MAG: PEP-CTERM sorting domain-containing protein [Isosphaeraceae bacterium]
MNLHKSRVLWGLALGVALSGWAARPAQADPIKYTIVGSINPPAANTPNLVYFNGVSNGDYTPPGNIDLGSFNVSTLSNSTTATYSNTPFTLTLSSGGAGEVISGVINGSVGPNVVNPGVTATITGTSPFGNPGLPFQLSLPLNTPMQLLPTSTSTGPASTGLTVAAVPEPASIAVFTIALGGLGVWHRRRRVA